MCLGTEVIEDPRLVLHMTGRVTLISEESSQNYANRDMGWGIRSSWFIDNVIIMKSIFSSLLTQVKSMAYKKPHFYTIYVCSPKGREVSYTA